MKRLLTVSLVALGALALAACGGDDDGDDGGGGGGGAWTAESFTGGNFEVVISGVSDGCFDGAMKTAILGADTTSTLPANVALPAWGSLPGTTDLDLNDPFQDVTGVAIDKQGTTGIATTGEGFVNDGVSFPNAGDPCTADMKISVALTLTDNDSFQGTTTLKISATNEDASCPAFTAGPPCDVTATVQGTRK